MNINERINIGSTLNVASASAAPVSLEQRLSPLASESVTDPEFERFYEAFSKWLNSQDALPRNSIQSFLKGYTSPAGEHTYATTKDQLALLTQVMVKMKAQVLEEHSDYKEVKKVSVQITSVHGFIQNFMMEAFQPSDDDDSRENVSW